MQKVKIVITSLIFSALLIILPNVVFAESETVGDVNGDGRVDTSDATGILRYILNEADISTERGDMNYDKKVDTADASYILKLLLHEYSLDEERVIDGATGVLTVTNDNIPFCYSADSSFYYPCPDTVYLPYGTIDYAKGEPYTVKNGNTVYTFINTVSGKRFQTKDVTVSEYKYMGKNRVNSVSVTNSESTLTFDLEMNWNVPFNIQYDGISYKNVSGNDFEVTDYNPGKISIELDYTVGVCDFVLPENNLFCGFSWEKDENGEYSLILRSDKIVKGTGFTSEYKDGHLLIKFTKPVTSEESDNEYGGTLSGQIVALSAGHGDWDSGAGATFGGVYYTELGLNNAIVAKIKAELEKAGATVVLCNDVSNHKPDYRARSKHAAEANAQIHIIIHQDSAAATATGFECWYYNPYSYLLAENLRSALKSFYVDTIYQNEYNRLMDRGASFGWYSDVVYPECPTVMIETGFLTNEKYCLEMQNEEMQTKLAKEIVKGIVIYGKQKV